MHSSKYIVEPCKYICMIHLWLTLASYCWMRWCYREMSLFNLSFIFPFSWSFQHAQSEISFECWLQYFPLHVYINVPLQVSLYDAPCLTKLVIKVACCKFILETFVLICMLPGTPYKADASTVNKCRHEYFTFPVREFDTQSWRILNEIWGSHSDYCNVNVVLGFL
jgi:hypothetical protein